MTAARRTFIGGLLAAGSLPCAVALFAMPAHAYSAGPSPWAICAAAGMTDQQVLEYTLSPANGATVQAGEAVTFSGQLQLPVTFSVASSLDLLASPDIDSGAGSAQTGSSLYTFTSTKAAAVPRTVYWTASFSTASLPECAGQTSTTYTTKPRTLTVLPNAAQKEREAQEERERREASERETREREAAARKSAERTASTGRCVVPSLKGDSLSKARRALAKAHCRLGAASAPRGARRGSLVVVRQSPRPGTRLAGGARVRVVLGHASRKRR